MVDYDLRALLPYILGLADSGRDYLYRELIWIRPSDNGKQDTVRRLLSFWPSKGLSAEELADLILKENLTPEETSELVNGLGRVAKTLIDYHCTFKDTASLLSQRGIPVDYTVPETLYVDL